MSGKVTKEQSEDKTPTADVFTKFNPFSKSVHP